MIQTLAAGKAIGIDLKNHNNAIHLFEQDCKILIAGPSIHHSQQTRTFISLHLFKLYFPFLFIMQNTYFYYITSIKDQRIYFT